MNKLLLLAFAPLAMLANPASAQTTTMQRTVSTPSHTTTTTRTVSRSTPVVSERTIVRSHSTTTVRHHPTHVTRNCHWKWRHHHKVRVCTTVRRHY